jgi:hypothetical protein
MEIDKGHPNPKLLLLLHGVSRLAFLSHAAYFRTPSHPFVLARLQTKLFSCSLPLSANAQSVCVLII